MFDLTIYVYIILYTYIHVGAAACAMCSMCFVFVPVPCILSTVCMGSGFGAFLAASMDDMACSCLIDGCLLLVIFQLARLGLDSQVFECTAWTV